MIKVENGVECAVLFDGEIAITKEGRVFGRKVKYHKASNTNRVHIKGLEYHLAKLILHAFTEDDYENISHVNYLDGDTMSLHLDNLVPTLKNVHPFKYMSL